MYAFMTFPMVYNPFKLKLLLLHVGLTCDIGLSVRNFNFGSLI